ncbi:hypothetical protein ABFP32_20585, partial [Acinetobacter bereziniae]
GSAIQPNSVSLKIPVSTPEGSTDYVDLTDTPISSSVGNLVNDQGQVQGSITYASGQCEVTPNLIKRVFETLYTATAVYGTA